MSTLSPGQIYTLATGAGLPPIQAAVATAVALAESGGRTDAEGDIGLQDSKWGPSIGLWQIRSLRAQTGTGGPRDASRLKDPVFNAASMAEISGQGSNFGPWTTFKNGAYKKFMQRVADDPTVEEDAGSVSGGLSQVGSYLGPILGAPFTGASAGAEAVDSFTSDWAKDAMKLGLYALGVAAAATLVIIGAVHAVSPKEA